MVERAREHARSFAWSVGVVLGLLTILSLLGLLPWATRAELVEFKADIAKKLDKIEGQMEGMRGRLEDIYRAVKSAP